jgi:hypothetical protein
VLRWRPSASGGGPDSRVNGGPDVLRGGRGLRDAGAEDSVDDDRQSKQLRSVKHETTIGKRSV